jgi:hypothetical protein
MKKILKILKVFTIFIMMTSSLFITMNEFHNQEENLIKSIILEDKTFNEFQDENFNNLEISNLKQLNEDLLKKMKILWSPMKILFLLIKL